MSSGPPHAPPSSDAITSTAPLFTSALSAEDLITLNEEIAALAKAGLPLDQGLAMLSREMGAGKLQRVTAKLADDLRAGLTLPEK